MHATQVVAAMDSDSRLGHGLLWRAPTGMPIAACTPLWSDGRRWATPTTLARSFTRTVSRLGRTALIVHAGHTPTAHTTTTSNAVPTIDTAPSSQITRPGSIAVANPRGMNALMGAVSITADIPPISAITPT